MNDKTDSLEGQFLIAMPSMGDPRFERTVIYLCAHSQEGAMGFVINQVMERPSMLDFMRQLSIISEDEEDGIPEELQHTPLHTGGPVEPGRGFVLHSPEYHLETTVRVDDQVSLTATLEILRAIATGRGPKRVMLALGYSGWASGQLEEEIAANGWLTSPADAAILFDAADESKYERALRRLGIDPSFLSGEAGHA
ncbi:MAG: YqgE/AlgH family protein [Salaquimonas sp.]|jgi:putative transcriptional regulator|nr:YqgE/AlgH family protein [Salaquimonas sp.]